MKLNLFIKQYAVWLALVFTLTMTAFYWWQDHHADVADESDLLAVKKGESHTAVSSSTDKQNKSASLTASLYQRRLYISQVDLFSGPHMPDESQTTVSAPTATPVIVSTPVAQQTPPPVPTAPPLPFTYVGRLVQDGKPALFLGVHGQDILVRQGDVIGQTYHVDDIGMTAVKLTYLPMQIQQTLNLEPLN